MDCQDASDECICSDVITGARAEGARGDNYFNNWAECLTTSIEYRKRYREKNTSIPSTQQCDIKQSVEACHLKCQGNSEHCKRINWRGHCLEKHMLKYLCSDGDDLSSEQGPFLGLHSELDRSHICDGKFDCASKVDEKNCSDRFVCKDGLRSIYKSQVCDESPDCSDLSDECQNCLKNGVSSDKEFIGNSILKWVIVFQCPLIIILNTISGAKHYNGKMKTKVGKIDRILCLSLTFFDMLMGLYLMVIVAKSFSYQGSYCAHDLEWRTSLQCSVTGSLMAISTQGSLLTAMMMSVTRCNTCLTPFSDKSYRLTIITFAALQLCSITLSLLPIMPINAIQDHLKTIIFFQGNPIVPKANSSLLRLILNRYTGEESSLGLSDLVTALGNMTSDKMLFTESASLGSYSLSPLCINLSGFHGLVSAKAIRVFLIGGVLAVVSLSYIIIAVYTTRSNPNAAQQNNGERSKFLSFKVSIIIASQVACWVPIIIVSIINLWGVQIDGGFYEVAAIVILPINSLTDPILYTNALQKMVAAVKKMWRDCNKGFGVGMEIVEMADINMAPDLVTKD